MMVTSGLFDLQVNGYAGVDFNTPALTPDALDHALAAMLSAGVTGCLPTLITAHEHELEERLMALDSAVANSRLGPQMVPGYHLEGPFLRSEPGYAGCHPAAAMRDPVAAKVLTWTSQIQRPILMVTLAPERAGSLAAISELVGAGITLAVGHSAASFEEIAAAADAGLSVSTHLGNGLPAQLPKLENTLLAQLADPRLTACYIADGHHLTPLALKAMIALKGTHRSVLVTDAVLAAAAAPGDYVFAGMPVHRDTQGVVRVPGQSNLAGSALELDQAIRNIVNWGIATFDEAVAMASVNPRLAITRSTKFHGLTLNSGSVSWNEDATVRKTTLKY